MSFNLADLPKEEMDKIEVDKEAAGVAYKERYGMPVIPDQVAAAQPEQLKAYFFERLEKHRKFSKTLSKLPIEHTEKK